MNKKIPIAILGLFTIVIVGSLLVSHGQATNKAANASSAAAAPAQTGSTSSGQAPGPAAATSATYKDGSYSAEGSYTSPDGNESVAVKLVVAGGNITSVTVIPEASDRRSMQYEQQFAQGIGQVVVGKPLASRFDVSEVNGSSLTGDGFTAALQTIRSQAKS